MSSHHSRETLIAEGEVAQALSTYKSILLTKPNDVDAQLSLAAIYRKLGQMNRAALAYELAAQMLAAQGNVKAGLAVVQLLVDMSPDNTDRRILLAEQYAKAELLADAVRELGVAADYLHRANQLDEYARVLDRLRKLESKSREAGMPPQGQEALSSATTAVLAQRTQGEPGAAERLSQSPPGATKVRTAAELPPAHVSAIIAEADSFLRLGLLDKAVELGPMEPADKKKMASRILGAFEREPEMFAAPVDALESLANYEARECRGTELADDAWEIAKGDRLDRRDAARGL